MSLFGNRLDKLIDELENSIPSVNTGFDLGFAIERHDWRPVWELCKQIQSEFKGYQGYETREEHQAAWDRFQTLRKRASELADIEKQKIAAQSDRLKDEILSEARSCYYSLSADFFVGTFLGQATVEEIQQLQSRLKDAGRRFSENKNLMTRADKEACFEAIKEARESHDRFWEKHKALTRERREASQTRREEFERKRTAWIARVQVNIEQNREKLERAQNALERTRDRIREIEDKLSDTNSPKWEGIYSEWLSEAQNKERDIEESIERIEGWIREGEDKLNDA